MPVCRQGTVEGLDGLQGLFSTFGRLAVGCDVDEIWSVPFRVKGARVKVVPVVFELFYGSILRSRSVKVAVVDESWPGWERHGCNFSEENQVTRGVSPQSRAPEIRQKSSFLYLRPSWQRVA